MEEAVPVTPGFSFGRFFLRSWLPNLVTTLIFVVVLIWCKNLYEHTTATRTTFLVNLVALPVLGVHALLLLIFSIRRFVRKQGFAGLCFFTHALLVLSLAYWFYFIIMLYGWAYMLKGH